MLGPREFARRSLAGIAPKLRVLVACEYSGIVRDAFTALGHNAISCDLLPTERPGAHYQGNVFDIINQQWDLMIAHPPCTHLAVSGSRWFKEKVKEQAEGLAFVQNLMIAGDYFYLNH